VGNFGGVWLALLGVALFAATGVVLAATSYSRVYVGVHYPTDVVAGAGLGIACGWIAAWYVVNIGRRPGRADLSEIVGSPREEVPEV
jgi:membrane-associated phospholipid phosphatase